MEQNQDEGSVRPPMFGTPGSRVWLLVALNFACIGLFSLLSGMESLSWITADPESGHPSWVGKLSTALYTIVIFLLPSVIFANAVPLERWATFEMRSSVRVAPLIICMITLIAALFWVDPLIVWSKSLVENPELKELEDVTQKYTAWILQFSGPGELMLCLLANAFVPALSEELFFRGLMQKNVAKWVRNPYMGILVTALLFSFLHFDITAFLARFVLGAMLGYIFFWSGNLWYSVAAHFAFNGFSILDEYWSTNYPDSSWAQMSNNWTLVSIGAVLSVGAFLTFRLLMKKRNRLSQGG